MSFQLRIAEEIDLFEAGDFICEPVEERGGREGEDFLVLFLKCREIELPERIMSGYGGSAEAVGARGIANLTQQAHQGVEMLTELSHGLPGCGGDGRLHFLMLHSGLRSADRSRQNQQSGRPWLSFVSISILWWAC